MVPYNLRILLIHFFNFNTLYIRNEPLLVIFWFSETPCKYNQSVVVRYYQIVFKIWFRKWFEQAEKYDNKL